MAQARRIEEVLRESEKRQPMIVLGLSRDVAERLHEQEERKALQERLNRVEKMEALGRLAGGVAHDLNDILGVAILYSELLREKIAEESPLRTYATQSFSSVEMAAAIIQDLLTLSGRSLPVSRRMNLNDIVSGCQNDDGPGYRSPARGTGGAAQGRDPEQVIPFE